LFFGIESFNQEASKLVRKKSGLVDNYKTLLDIKNVSPNTYTVGGIILGLNKDSEESIRQSTNRIIEEKLLNSIQMYSLLISKSNTITSIDYLSELDKDPSKYGYETESVATFHHDNKYIPIYHWKSDWTTLDNAEKLKYSIEKEITGKIDLLGHLEYAGYCTLGIYKNELNNALRNKSFNIASQLKRKYIEEKIKVINQL
jgi:hypothetical protein